MLVFSKKQHKKHTHTPPNKQTNTVKTVTSATEESRLGHRVVGEGSEGNDCVHGY